MAKKIIGFDSESDFDRMSKFVRKSEASQQSGQHNRRIYPLGASGGNVVRFQIRSLDTESDPKSATVKILSRDHSTSKVPEENEDAEIVVYDKTECHIVEPYEELICKTGYARYMKDLSTEEKQWEIRSLDCETSCNVLHYSIGESTLPAGADVIFMTTGLSPGPYCEWPDVFAPILATRIQNVIDFIKTGKSVVVFGEVYNTGICMTSAEIGRLNAFYSAIGGLAYLTLDDLVVGCQTGAIVADDTHPFVKDYNGDQNVFFYGIGGSSKVNENGSTALAYVYDTATETTDTSNCVLAGNKYPEEGAGWVFLAGDSNMMDTCISYGDIETFYTNLCRLQCTGLPDE